MKQIYPKYYHSYIFTINIKKNINWIFTLFPSYKVFKIQSVATCGW